MNPDLTLKTTQVKLRTDFSTCLPDLQAILPTPIPHKKGHTLFRFRSTEYSLSFDRNNRSFCPSMKTVISYSDTDLTLEKDTKHCHFKRYQTLENGIGKKDWITKIQK